MRSLLRSTTLQSVMGPGPAGSFRYSHLSTSPSNINAWANFGYNRDDTKQFLEATQATMDDPNTALDLRIANGPVYK